MASDDEEDDVIDDSINGYSSQSYPNNYASDQENKYDSEIDEEENEENENVEQEQEQIVQESQEREEQSELQSHKIEESDQRALIFKGDDEDYVKRAIQKAAKYNINLLKQKKKLKEQFKSFEKSQHQLRANLKEYDMPYQTAHIPLHLKTKNRFVILPAQNLNIRKGTIEQFIKTNLDNENQIKKQELDRRMAIKQRKPYQKRRFDP
ncbi:hypothetical protein pb186bvf_000737 [Paramecium bursaria]